MSLLNIYIYKMFFKAQELPKPEEPAVHPAAVKVTPSTQERLPVKGINR